MARLRARDPDVARQKRNDFHARNREQQTEKMRDYYARRFFWGRAMKLRGEGRATYRELAAIWKRQHGLCALTGERLTRENVDVDHILPKTRGGSDASGNLRWVTRTVNLAKRDLTDDEFFALCGNVMRWIGRRIELTSQLSSQLSGGENG
jgi:5-methylcytosine-specific restriction endonuclease McrA